MKNLLLLISILISNFGFGQRSADNVFSVKVKFDDKIPVTELKVYYTDAISVGYNSFSTINYTINKQTNEVELLGKNVWVAGNNSHFPLIIFAHLKKGGNSAEEGYDTRSKQVFYYLLNENPTFESNLNKEIFFKKLNSTRAYVLRIDQDGKMDYDFNTQIMLDYLVEVHPLED